MNGEKIADQSPEMGVGSGFFMQSSPGYLSKMIHQCVLLLYAILASLSTCSGFSPSLKTPISS